MEEKSKKITASVILVDFLKAEKARKCIAGFLAQEGNFSREVLVMDNSQNAENAKILRHIPGINFLNISEKNLGYSSANNFCAQKSKGDFLFFLNPDIEFLDKNCIHKILFFLEKNPEVVILGPRQQNPDGSTECTARNFPDFVALIARRTFFRKFFQARVSHYEMKNFDFSKTQEVPWIQSSFWAVRRDFFEESGGFSERFFCFFADTELCKKAHEKGKKVIFFAETEVGADGIRASSGGFLTFFTKKIIRIHFHDAIRYFFPKLH